MKEEVQKDENGDALCDLGAAKSTHGDIFCLSIIGEIEGHGVLDSSRKTTKYEHLLPLLFSLEEDSDFWLGKTNLSPSGSMASVFKNRMADKPVLVRVCTR